jgi:hypothetical protein
MRFEIEAADLDSSNLKKIEYLSSTDGVLKLDDKGELIITFQTGKKYVYYDVPVNVVIDLVSSESLGKKFNSTIRSSTFRYKQLT